MSLQAANQPTTLPGGASLAPGEVPLVGDTFMFSTIAFYLHTELVLTNRRLYAVRPNTIFGLIPVGTGHSNYPVENIAGVSAGTRFDVVGAILVRSLSSSALLRWQSQAQRRSEFCSLSSR